MDLLGNQSKRKQNICCQNPFQANKKTGKGKKGCKVWGGISKFLYKVRQGLLLFRIKRGKALSIY
jgi:hypothetical protein